MRLDQPLADAQAQPQPQPASKAALVDGQAAATPSVLLAVLQFNEGRKASRVRLKLLNPLGVAEGLADKYLAAARGRLDLLADDLEAMARTSDNPDVRFDAQLVLGLVTALAHDPELRQIIREQFLGRGGIRLREVFERAVARGEIPQGRNLDLLVSVFPALALQHLLIFGELPDASFASKVMNDLILPLAVAPL